MKRQHNPSTKAHLLWSALILLVLLAVCAIPFALAQRNSGKRSAAINSAPVQSTSPKSAPVDPWEAAAGDTGDQKYMVWIMPPGLPGPYRLPGFEYPGPVPKSLLPSVNALINNNNGS